MSQTISLIISGNFINLCPEFCSVNRRCQPALQSLQQFLHTLQLQRRAKIAGKNLSFPDHTADFFIRNLTIFQIFLQHLFITHSQSLQYLSALIQKGKINTAFIQMRTDILQKKMPVRSRLIHFIHKQKSGNLIPFQKSPQSFCMSLHSVRTADYKNRAVQNLQCSLHLCRKIHMSRRVKKRYFQISQRQLRLLGKYSNSSRSL